jgi:hypothetical protein
MPIWNALLYLALSLALLVLSMFYWGDKDYEQ